MSALGRARRQGTPEDAKPTSDPTIFTQRPYTIKMNKLVILAALVASASAFAPAAKPAFTSSLAGKKVNWEDAAELGWSMGGEDYTRDLPKEVVHEDPRKAIPDAPSFEEYMKARASGN